MRNIWKKTEKKKKKNQAILRSFSKLMTFSWCMQEQFIMLQYPNPTHLTYRLQSESIMLALSKLAHHSPSTYMATNTSLSCLTCSPILQRRLSISQASLLIWRLCCSLAWVQACYYAFSWDSSIVIEHSFMHNTFQVEFMSHHSSKCWCYAYTHTLPLFSLITGLALIA